MYWDVLYCHLHVTTYSLLKTMTVPETIKRHEPHRSALARARPLGGEALSARLALPCGEGVAAWALVGHLGCAGAAAGRATLVETAA